MLFIVVVCLFGVLVGIRVGVCDLRVVGWVVIVGWVWFRERACLFGKVVLI